MTMQEPFTIEYGIDRDGERYWRITIPHGRNWNEQYYALGHEPPNFPVPATARTFRHSWGNDTAHVTIWPGVMQQRISDEPYTGFGQVITFQLNTGECETRYDDFD